MRADDRWVTCGWLGGTPEIPADTETPIGSTHLFPFEQHNVALENVTIIQQDYGETNDLHRKTLAKNQTKCQNIFWQNHYQHPKQYCHNL
ncbi:MAG TPA: hypothetical protein VK999_08500 [Methylotenera sp.]|nr:hypothetical protein [Methylotenera sp.]